MKNWADTLHAQYANSPTILGLIESFNAAIDPAADIEAIFSTIWNIETANSYGLEVWGKIVGVSRMLTMHAVEQFLGFFEAKTTEERSSTPFGFGVLYNEEELSMTYELPDDEYRKLIMVKAMSNITSATLPNLNTLLRLFFKDRGRAFVHRTGEMEITVSFEFFLSNIEFSILTSTGAFPTPAGVLMRIVQMNPSETFGFFEGAEFAPFGEGAFFNFWH